VFEPPLSPKQLEWMEQGLKAFDATPLSPSEALSAMMLVNIYVRGTGQIATHLLTGSEEASAADQTYLRRLALLADRERFPTIAGNLEASDPEDFGVDYNADEFQFGLDTVLDGIEALIARRTTT
jgi:hypothetical protein